MATSDKAKTTAEKRQVQGKGNDREGTSGADSGTGPGKRIQAAAERYGVEVSASNWRELFRGGRPPTR
jgi:hypothetical protein